ncbi:MAG: PD40 domain-containing protein [Sphingomonas sp.]|nr:PD40 domain-containing protein [Sphingomonas sp.]
MEPAREIAFRTQEGTWLSPDLSPDGRRIVFELLGDLYVMDARGGAAHPIATGMPFDSQPIFSPDGERVAFVSDRSGTENVWIAGIDGRNPRPVTQLTGDAILTSPSWSADGKTIYVSRFHPDYVAFELLSVPLATGQPHVIVPVSGDQSSSTVGAEASKDGRWLYYASQVGTKDSTPPAWVIRRRNLATGAEETLVEPPRSYRPDLVLGTFFRPLPSPDGKLLVYATRYGPQMWLRVLDLRTHDDRWLVKLTEHDELESAAWRDFAPHYAFTPDSRALVVNNGGALQRVSLTDGAETNIPFSADVRVPLGPLNRPVIREDTGPVHARIIQWPVASPDGKRLAFSALGQIYTMDLTARGQPRRLTRDSFGEFQPSWSPDGRSIIYVRWTARAGGQIYRVDAEGSRPPVRITRTSAYYTSPVLTPDGRTIVVERSSNYVRMHRYMEYGPLRDAELVLMPASGGEQRVIAQGSMGGTPHFGPDGAEVLMLFDDGLNAVKLDGSGRRLLVQVTGPGYYFLPGRAPVDDLRLSPDGQWLLAQTAQQLFLIGRPAKDGTTIDLASPGVPHRKLTEVGADFFQWGSDGRSIGWGLGSSWFSRPLADVHLLPPNSESATADPGTPARWNADVVIARADASGALLFRGATAITMGGKGTIANADVLVIDGRIAAVGQRGSIPLPAGVQVRDLAGKYLVPGFIDDHDHVADIRRGQLDLESWGVAANLAYGITTAFDPSTLSIDMLAYQDLIDAGLITGSRIRSTGPALFSFNAFRSKEEVDRVLDRYRDFYRLRNLKLYRTGNREVREWVSQSAREHGLRVTTEGANSDKLDLTQVQDGVSGSEHALQMTPLYKDVVQLMARSGVSYNTTLMIEGGGQDYFVVDRKPNGDPRLNRFAPRFIVDMKTRKRDWRELADDQFPAFATQALKIERAGGIVGMGSHGEIPGLGFHWEMEAHVMGGWTPEEALRAATLGSAEAIGREADLGSIEPGKIADLVILDRDPRADIRNSLSIASVMQGGKLYDGSTLDELWPHAHSFPRAWYRDDRPPGEPDPADGAVLLAAQPSSHGDPR